ncbi:MAG: 5-deoxy-glucuronate isomerase [Firmicutes bacterium]|nr:5-deoxy-glucuronate isomerase [Bacillota bacterium]
MSKYLLKGQPPGPGCHVLVNEDNSPLKLLRLSRILLTPELSVYEGSTEDREAALHILGGKAAVRVSTKTGLNLDYPNIGGRRDVFQGAPTTVYIPRESTFTISRRSPRLDVLLVSAPARVDTAPALIRPEEAPMNVAGANNWRRRVYNCIGENVQADRLLVGETFGAPGAWSSYPPHKHDSDKPPYEMPAEEVYFFQINPPQGFAVMRVYTDKDDPEPFDEVFLIENNDIGLIPRGYHPVSAAGGYEVYYFWAIAGDQRLYGAWSEDPQHAWVKHCERLLD